MGTGAGRYGRGIGDRMLGISVGMALLTASRILSVIAMSKLGRLGLAPVPLSERQRPGDLVALSCVPIENPPTEPTG